RQLPRRRPDRVRYGRSGRCEGREARRRPRGRAGPRLVGARRHASGGDRRRRRGRRNLTGQDRSGDRRLRRRDEPQLSSSAADPSFEGLLQWVRDTRGFDYAGYKRPSLMRRFEKRLLAVKAANWDEYRSFLEANPDEFNELFDTILINVTGFFRDPETWQLLQEDVIPKIIEQRGRRGPIRVWTAGCASGEEAYSVAILFAEGLGEDASKEGVKISATDVDEEALNQPRHAAYSTKQLSVVPDELRAKYFSGANHRLSFRNDIRRCVIFGR